MTVTQSIRLKLCLDTGAEGTLVSLAGKSRSADRRFHIFVPGGGIEQAEREHHINGVRDVSSCMDLPSSSSSIKKHGCFVHGGAHGKLIGHFTYLFHVTFQI